MRKMTFAIMVLAAGMTAVYAADVKGSKDHPLLPRYEDSEIIRYEQKAFEEYQILVAPADTPGGKEKNASSFLRIEGRFTQIAYRAPAGRSTLEVARNYEQALKAAGFKTVFACDRSNCGGRNFNLAVAGKELYMLFGDQPQQRYIAAKLERPEGDVYAAVYIVLSKSGGANKDRSLALLEVVEIKPMEQRMKVVEASAMERDMTTTGRATLYGILFDFDKDTMRADSKAQLDEIAKLLKSKPQLKVLIVGHTDAKGSTDYNRSLSERRAASIVGALVRDYGVERARLTPVGVGMASPVATNRTEEGRTLNRRVELVDLSS